MWKEKKGLVSIGFVKGLSVGLRIGFAVGSHVGSLEGSWIGCPVGRNDGWLVVVTFSTVGCTVVPEFDPQML